MIWKTEKELILPDRILKLCYFVTSPILSPALSRPCYGIGISDGIRTVTVRAFSPEKEETIRVALLLARMEVTTVSFYDVLEDYLLTR